MADEKVAVGISNHRRSIGALKWALENLVSEGDEITLIHVHHPIRYVPTPVGNLAVGQLSAEKVATYRRILQNKIDEFVELCKGLCNAHQVKPKYVQVESDSVQKALVDQVSVLSIKKLVLGTSGYRGITRRLSGSGVPVYVSRRAPAFCHVLMISKNKVIPAKEADDRSLSSSSSQTSDSEASDVYNVSSSSCSSQGDMEAHPSGKVAGRLHRLPEGLGQRWNSLTRYLSFGSSHSLFERNLVPASPSLPPAPPLNEIGGARMFISPFRDPERDPEPEPEPDTSSPGYTGVNGTLALINHKIAETMSQSSSSSGTKSCESSESEGHNHPRTATREQKTTRMQEPVKEEAIEYVTSPRNTTSRIMLNEEEQGDDNSGITSAFSRLGLSIQESAETNDNAETVKEIEAPSTPTRPVSKRKTLRELTQLAQRKFREYEYAELKAATNNFFNDLKLGEGGYGLVYKGKLHGKDVAIKVLKKEGFQRTQEFQHEVELLGRIQHPHMVVLLGCCSERGCLVYEYMANGSLDDRLFCKGGTPALSWYSRFRIAAEVASALHFLHNLGPEPIVHRDLKPANILLDHNYVSKVGDVGLARLVPERLAAINSTYFRDTTPVGTFAYIDPEYQRTGSFGPKSDVYALGIVILQLLTGKPPVGVHAIVEEAIECGTFSSILDQSAGEWPLGKAEEVACLALQCAEMKRRQRPNLEMVLPMLDSARAFAENCAAITATNKAMSKDAGLIIPSIFLCPIFQEVMEEPVVAADGYTYEYEAIRQWFQAHDTSPLTNLKLEHKQLTPHHALNKLISEWKARN